MENQHKLSTVFVIKMSALQVHMIIQFVCLTHGVIHLFSELIMALQWKVLLCFLVEELLHLQVDGFVTVFFCVHFCD